MSNWGRHFCLGVLALLGCTSNGQAIESVPVFIAQPLYDANGVPRQASLWRVRTKLINRVAEVAGFAADIRPLPWRRAQAMAETGAGLLWLVANTPERNTRFLLSEPVTVQPIWVVTLPDSNWQFHKLDDLRGKVVSSLSGAQYGGEFEAARGKLFTVEDNASTLAAQLQMLRVKRVDAVVLGSLRSTQAAISSYLDCYYGNLGRWRIAPQPLSMESLHVAAAHGFAITALIPRINEALAELNRRGEIKALAEEFNNAPLENCS